MIGILLIVVVIAVALWVIGSYNGFVRAKNNVEEAFSTMDVYLKKRFDLIPNLVETVKGYANHESATLEKVTAARSAVMKSSTTAEKLKNENILSGTLRSLFAVSESYPDLKANTNFMDLQKQLKDIEGEIASSRKYYNGVVKIFNNKCEIFPSNILAKLFHFEKKPMYEVAHEEERENVKVQF